MQNLPMVDTFDLIATPDCIGPEYGFMVLFLAVGVGMLCAALVLLRFTRGRRSETLIQLRHMGWCLMPFSVIWLGFTSYMSLGDIQSARVTRELVQDGKYRTLEGFLDYFRAGKANPGKTIAGDEKWAVDGYPFRYGVNQVRFAYHKVEPLGGIVHSNSWVRVSFTRDAFLGRDDIVRLEVKQNACPPAVDAPNS